MHSSGARRLADYRKHYTLDAEAIVDPADLPPPRRASERRRLSALLRILAPQRGDHVLDVGCGSGWLAAECGRAGAAAYALDIALRGVASARARYPGQAAFLVGDVYGLPFDGNTFSAAVLSEVVEHVDDVAGALGEVRRVLRPAGRALVSVPYCEQITYHLCIHCNRPTPANAHLHSFGPGDLENMLAASGLRPERRLLLTNKVLECFGFAYRSRHWPYWLWRAADRLCNRIVPRAAFLCVLARRVN